MKSKSKIKTQEDFDKIAAQGLKLIYPNKLKISVSMLTCGVSAGARKVFDAMKNYLETTNKNNDVILTQTGCFGFCQREPIITVYIPKSPLLIYCEITPEKSVEIIDSLLKGEIKKEKLLCKVPLPYANPEEQLTGVPNYEDIPFFSKQRKLILRNCGFINPASIEEYIAVGGYKSLFKAVTSLTPTDVIEKIKKSGLRGRGGAGFPTGVKWEAVKNAEGREKFLICNGDEGDPGAFMDRLILEGDPHSVIEGMLIASFAIGAKKGFAYVRSEYPLAVKSLTKAIEQAKELGLLGRAILGRKGFDFDIEIMEGAGAFVCGEETSLIASLEGKRGMPRPRPPYPATSGFLGKPTNINNVKTYASVPVIIDKGGEWFASIGTEKSKGTIVFALTGKVNNSGLIEVPMGITLRDIVYSIGGGIQDGKGFKSAQTGGPSGGCIPSQYLDTPIDYESLASAGSMMGSGGIVVTDESTCMVDFARFFISFTQKESCGKCPPCRIGTKHMLDILTKITEGKGEEEDIKILEDIAHKVKATSLCGLGQTAPNPVITTLRYFREEYEQHVKFKRCPANQCKNLINFYIIPSKCVGCLLCLKNCPSDAITGELKKLHIINNEKCIKCGICIDVCPKKISAVVKYSGENPYLETDRQRV